MSKCSLPLPVLVGCTEFNHTEFILIKVKVDGLLAMKEE